MRGTEEARIIGLARDPSGQSRISWTIMDTDYKWKEQLCIGQYFVFISIRSVALSFVFLDYFTTFLHADMLLALRTTLPFSLSGKN